MAIACLDREEDIAGRVLAEVGTSAKALRERFEAFAASQPQARGFPRMPSRGFSRL